MKMQRNCHFIPSYQEGSLQNIINRNNVPTLDRMDVSHIEIELSRFCYLDTCKKKFLYSYLLNPRGYAYICIDCICI